MYGIVAVVAGLELTLVWVSEFVLWNLYSYKLIPQTAGRGCFLLDQLHKPEDKLPYFWYFVADWQDLEGV